MYTDIYIANCICLYSLPKSKNSKIKTLPVINSDIIHVNSMYMYVQICLYLHVNAWTNIFTILLATNFLFERYL